MTDSVLLIEPHSVVHGPPDEVRIQDESISKSYSNALDFAIKKRMNNSTSANWNAVSTRFISNYGVLMLSTVFKNNDCKVHYLNGDYYSSMDEFINAVLKSAEECAAICFTGTTPQYLDCCKIAEIVSKSYPSKLLVFGGPHAYFFKNHWELTPFHLICIGHNIIQSANKILSFVRSGEIPKSTVLFKTEGYVDVSKDFSIIPSKHIEETLLYSYISYGCPNSCKYCVEHTFNPCVSFLSLDDKIKEIKFLVLDAHVRSVHLADSDFFLNPTFAEKFLNLLKEADLNCCFSVNTSPYILCQPHTLKLIAQFIKLGLIELLIGTEYFSQEVLQFLNKRYNIERFYYALKHIREEFPELLISFYSLIGLPGENKQTISENYEWTMKFKANQLYDYSFPKFFVPYPGTDVFEHPQEYNAKILHMRWNEYHRWSLPRPISIQGLSDEDFMSELLALYAIGGITVGE